MKPKDDTTRRHIARQLRAARHLVGITQEVAAIALDVKRQTLSMWERGLQPVPSDMVPAICKLYKWDANTLLLQMDEASGYEGARVRAELRLEGVGV